MLPILTRSRIQSIRTAWDSAAPMADSDLLRPAAPSLAVPGNRWSRLARLGGLASGVAGGMLAPTTSACPISPPAFATPV